MRPFVCFVVVLIVASFMSAAPVQQAGQPIPLPQRDQIAVQDLRDQIADCSINAQSQTKYEAKLVARIRELEKQVSDLQKQDKGVMPLGKAEDKSK